MIQPEKDHSEPTNPFRPGMGLDPPYLSYPSAQLDLFNKYLAGFPAFPRNVRLTGLRGVGKTVLLQHYAAAAEARGWVVVRRECSEHLQNESTFALALVEDCRSAVEHSSRTLALRQRSTAAARRALDLLGGLTVTLEGVTLAVKPPTYATRIGHFALQAGVPISPVAVRGTDVLRPFSRVDVTIGPPVRPDPPAWWSVGQKVTQVVDNVQRAITAGLQRTRGRRPKD